MQKWEYMTAYVANIEVKRNEWSLKVTVLNETPQYKGSGMGANFKNCQDWISFLAQAGEEGWELVGLAGTGQGLYFEAIFKRPK